MNIMVGATALMIAMLIITLFLQIKAAHKRKTQGIARATPRVRMAKYSNDDRSILLEEEGVKSVNSSKKNYFVSQELKTKQEFKIDEVDVLFSSSPKTPALSSEVKKEEKKIRVLYVMAPSHRLFNSYELLQALLAANLRYGEKKIFHRYAEENKQVLFSVAQATEPGIFDLQKMGNVQIMGLTFFLYASDKEASQSFKEMMQCAQQLAEVLDGLLLDQEKRILNLERFYQ